MEDCDVLCDDLRLALQEDFYRLSCARSEVTLETERKSLCALVERLRGHGSLKFTTLIDICGVDYPDRALRFDVVYHLLSLVHNRRIRLKISVAEGLPVPSLTGIFPGALWFEREAYDMYGILFSGHPDLRRLLTDYGFEGFPLRKDFPVSGFHEVRYDEHVKRVVKKPIDWVQPYRAFDFESPWEGSGFHRESAQGEQNTAEDKGAATAQGQRKPL